jgi:2-dehydro-3-deoxyphosphogluconate aldolase / (4S)-4-hydroxy-2-oxoglutarate aldolase
MPQAIAQIDEYLNQAPVLPVLAVDDVPQALALVTALADAGLVVVEITLRTAAAVPAIAAIRKALPQVIVSAGTVLTLADLHAVQDAGAHFAISPGATDTLLRAVESVAMPFLPGVANASDIQRGLDFGYQRFKLFPATAVGGVDALKAYAGPFASVKFCPTGGINASNAASFLSLSNVITVGGSWMVDKAALKAGDFTAIKLAAAACVGLRK